MGSAAKGSEGKARNIRYSSNAKLRVIREMLQVRLSEVKCPELTGVVVLKYEGPWGPG